MDPVIACTLDGSAIPQRLTTWDAVLRGAGVRTTTADGATRIELGEGTDLGALAELVVAERACCPFLSFAITVDDRGRGLEVRAPAAAAHVVAAIFEPPPPPASAG